MTPTIAHDVYTIDFDLPENTIVTVPSVVQTINSVAINPEQKTEPTNYFSFLWAGCLAGWCAEGCATLLQKCKTSCTTLLHSCWQCVTFAALGCCAIASVVLRCVQCLMRALTCGIAFIMGIAVLQLLFCLLTCFGWLLWSVMFGCPMDEPNLLICFAKPPQNDNRRRSGGHFTICCKSTSDFQATWHQLRQWQYYWVTFCVAPFFEEKGKH